MPKVSIVLPTYNGKQYLEQSVNSIFAQTFTDWELIFVDDCSTDGTADIVDRYMESNPRIHVIHNEKNQKLPGSLNIGFAKANGEYLTWTSDDNLYLPDALEEMVQYLDSHLETPMVCCNMQIIDSEGKVTGLSGFYTAEKIYTYNCLGACFLYRKEVREKIGDYDTDTFCVEDYDYWLRVLDSCGKIASIDKILYQYRRHEASLSEVRKKQVLDQLTKLRIRYIDTILDVLRLNQGELCRIYYEMRRSRYMTQEIKKRFWQAVPELCCEIPVTADKKYFIFGAGKYGERAVARFGTQAIAFVDSDPAKAGKVKYGLEILPFKEAVSHADDYIFMIAVAGERILEMMQQLLQAGIKEYSVFTADRLVI